MVAGKIFRCGYYDVYVVVCLHCCDIFFEDRVMSVLWCFSADLVSLHLF
jgi:hypothetical protein